MSQTAVCNALVLFSDESLDSTAYFESKSVDRLSRQECKHPGGEFPATLKNRGFAILRCGGLNLEFPARTLLGGA